MGKKMRKVGNKSSFSYIYITQMPNLLMLRLIVCASSFVHILQVKQRPTAINGGEDKKNGLNEDNYS